ncbi:unannotated protein [freshwater metagenome]|uniref:Unannotated protein n=1 Tax=freshwater metagenome TaxID=449393 RepID=A0A6J7W7G1_9ZZZZ
MYPIVAALSKMRRKTLRGSAGDGVPSGMVMSQNMRAAPGDSVRHGKIEKVEGSGFANMSDSVTRAKPSIAEPSKPMPSSNAFSSSAGAMATDFKKPKTSVNHKRTKRILRSSMVRRTNSFCLSASSDMPAFSQRQVTAVLTG